MGSTVRRTASVGRDQRQQSVTSPRELALASLDIRDTTAKEVQYIDNKN